MLQRTEGTQRKRACRKLLRCCPHPEMLILAMAGPPCQSVSMGARQRNKQATWGSHAMPSRLVWPWARGVHILATKTADRNIATFLEQVPSIHPRDRKDYRMMGLEVEVSTRPHGGAERHRCYYVSHYLPEVRRFNLHTATYNDEEPTWVWPTRQWLTLPQPPTWTKSLGKIAKAVCLNQQVSPQDRVKFIWAQSLYLPSDA